MASGGRLLSFRWQARRPRLMPPRHEGNAGCRYDRFTLSEGAIFNCPGSPVPDSKLAPQLRPLWHARGRSWTSAVDLYTHLHCSAEATSTRCQARSGVTEVASARGESASKPAPRGRLHPLCPRDLPEPSRRGARRVGRRGCAGLDRSVSRCFGRSSNAADGALTRCVDICVDIAVDICRLEIRGRRSDT